MIKELCIVGHPSHLGGADTELDHQIHAWQNMNIRVHICHTSPLDANLKRMRMDLRGCVYHKPNDWKSLEGFHVISFCNGKFLQYLREIKKYAKTTTFVNCMTWNFNKEIKCQKEGLIDFHLYQSDHGLQMVSRKLRTLGKPFRAIRIQPYFYQEDFPFVDNRPTEKFQLGRISRGDADKYHKKQLWIYEQFNCPTKKDIIILGWDKRAQRKFNNPILPHNIRTYQEGGITQKEFYKHSDVVSLMTKTFENLPRVGFEAMSSGSVLVVDDRGGWKVEVDSGKTGFLCKDEEDFVSKLALISHNKDMRDQMRNLAKEKLVREWGIETSMKSWENVFSQWEKLN